MSGGSGGGGGGLFNDPVQLALLAGTAIAAPYAAPLLFEGGMLAGSAALGAGVTGMGIGALGGAALGYNPIQTGIMGGLGGAATGAMGLGAPGTLSGTGGGFGLTSTGAGAGSTFGALNPAAATGTFGSLSAPTVAGGTISGLGAGTSMTPGAASILGSTAGGASLGGGAAASSLIPGVSNTALGWGAGGLGLAALMNQDAKKYGVPASATTPYAGGNLSKFHYDPANYQPDIVQPPRPVYVPTYAGYARPAGYADGGLLDPNSEPVDFMGGDMYPQSQQERSYYATPTQAPTSAQQALASYEPRTNPLTGQPTAHMRSGGTPKDAMKDLMGSRDAMDKYRSQYAVQPSKVLSQAKDGDYNAMLALNQIKKTPGMNYAGGGLSSLGGYSDGGRMLKGPGDGMSDSIPASINGKRPARLADGEFVVPADVVSHIGNGSTDAGAKKLYSMMNKVRKARTGKVKQAPAINSSKYVPA